jgi:hypothetical protein
VSGDRVQWWGAETLEGSQSRADTDDGRLDFEFTNVRTTMANNRSCVKHHAGLGATLLSVTLAFLLGYGLPEALGFGVHPPMKWSKPTVVSSKVLLFASSISSPLYRDSVDGPASAADLSITESTVSMSGQKVGLLLLNLGGPESSEDVEGRLIQMLPVLSRVSNTSKTGVPQFKEQ